jgi:type VI secretion system secreted protein Hcp
MRTKRTLRLAAPLSAAVITSAVVAAIALGGSSSTQTAKAGAPPTPNGQVAGQLVLDGGAPIPILSFSWGVSNPVTIGSGGGGAGAGKASFSSFNVMKNVDASSIALILASAKGTHYQAATFTATWGSGPTAAKLVMDLGQVFVESVQQSGAGGVAPTESVSFAYGSVHWTFNDAGGTTSGDWNIATNSSS